MSSLLSNPTFILLMGAIWTITGISVFFAARCLRHRTEPHIRKKLFDHFTGLQIVTLITLVPIILVWCLVLPEIIMAMTTMSMDLVDSMLGGIGILVLYLIALYKGWGGPNYEELNPSVPTSAYSAEEET